MGKLKHKAYQALGKAMGMPNTRKFDGKTYYMATKGMGLPKGKAEAYATKLRKGGQKARIAKTRIGNWCVYVKD